MLKNTTFITFDPFQSQKIATTLHTFDKTHPSYQLIHEFAFYVSEASIRFSVFDLYDIDLNLLTSVRLIPLPKEFIIYNIVQFSDGRRNGHVLVYLTDFLKDFLNYDKCFLVQNLCREAFAQKINGPVHNECIKVIYKSTPDRELRSKQCASHYTDTLLHPSVHRS